MMPALRRAALRRAGLRLLVFAVLMAVWQLSVRLVPGTQRVYFPPPLAIAGEMRHLWFTGPVGHLFLNADGTRTILPSLGRVVCGWTLAAAAGIPSGLLLGRWQTALDVADPVLQFFRAIPTPMLIPVFIVLFGLGNIMHVAVIVFGATWPVLLNTIDGTASADPLQVETARVMRMSAVGLLARVVLPAAGPQIFAGLRTALSLSLILMVISEIVGTTDGIGAALSSAQQSFAITAVWAIIALLGILGYLLNGFLLWAEHRLLGWQPTVTGLREAIRSS